MYYVVFRTDMAICSGVTLCHDLRVAFPQYVQYNTSVKAIKVIIVEKLFCLESGPDGGLVSLADISGASEKIYAVGLEDFLHLR